MTQLSLLKILCFVIYPCIFIIYNITSYELIQLKLNVDVSLSNIDERYLSFALDSGIIRHNWGDFDFKSADILALARGLTPSYLRIGGTAEDELVFKTDATGVRYDMHSKFSMTGKQVSQLGDFAEEVDLLILFGFNVLLRHSDDSWNSNNAKSFLKFCAHHGYSNRLGFELGNEPNSFKHSFNRSVAPEQLAQDFGTLRNVLNHDEHLSKFYKNSHIVGPDVTNPRVTRLERRQDEWTVPSDSYLKQFLPVGKQFINAVTFHHYYMGGSTATVSDFMDPAVLDSLADNVVVMQNVLTDTNTSIPLWIGETASAYGGGAKNISDRYVSGFLWLNKLGVCAQLGVQVVVRQSLYQGHYALLNPRSKPNPDYWLSWVFKNLVGTTVLNVTLSHDSSDGAGGRDNVRMFSHCTSHRSIYPTGSVVLYGLNVNRHRVTIELPGNYTIHEYLLTPNNGHLTDSLVKLNNILLKLTNHKLPLLKPRPLATHSSFEIPSQRFGFWVLHNAGAKSCMNRL